MASVVTACTGDTAAIVGLIAALNLVLDFDFIEQAAERGAPKYLEWYGAFALMVTLVWLYMEILRLLSKLRSRNSPWPGTPPNGWGGTPPAWIHHPPGYMGIPLQPCCQQWFR
jgi:hypothetical protein